MSAAPHQLLCESCGYPLRGIDTSLACPECGRPIVQSLPNGRPGSPWQKASGVEAWAATGWNVLSHPRAVWADIRPEQSQAFLLFMINAAIASALATLALIPGPQWSPSIGYMQAFFFSFFLLIGLLSFVEALGIWFLGRRQGRKRSRSFQIAIVGHASFAWIISGAALALGCQVLQHIDPAWLATMSLPGSVSGTFIAQTMIGAGFMSGMLLFSTLCGLGFRALRYANP